MERVVESGGEVGDERGGEEVEGWEEGEGVGGGGGGKGEGRKQGGSRASGV